MTTPDNHPDMAQGASGGRKRIFITDKDTDTEQELPGCGKRVYTPDNQPLTLLGELLKRKLSGDGDSCSGTSLGAILKRKLKDGHLIAAIDAIPPDIWTALDVSDSSRINARKLAGEDALKGRLNELSLLLKNGALWGERLQTRSSACLDEALRVCVEVESTLHPRYLGQFNSEQLADQSRWQRDSNTLANLHARLKQSLEQVRTSLAVCRKAANQRQELESILTTLQATIRDACATDGRLKAERDTLLTLGRKVQRHCLEQDHPDYEQARRDAFRQSEERCAAYALALRKG